MLEKTHFTGFFIKLFEFTRKSSYNILENIENDTAYISKRSCNK